MSCSFNYFYKNTNLYKIIIIKFCRQITIINVNPSRNNHTWTWNFWFSKDYKANYSVQLEQLWFTPYRKMRTKTNYSCTILLARFRHGNEYSVTFGSPTIINEAHEFCYARARTGAAKKLILRGWAVTVGSIIPYVAE